MNSALSPCTTYCLFLIFLPLTVVPVFVFRSSRVRVDRLEGRYAWSFCTSSTVMVKCRLDMVMWDIATWPADERVSFELYG